MASLFAAHAIKMPEPPRRPDANRVSDLSDWIDCLPEIGYQVVFIRELTTCLLLVLAASGLTAGVLYLNLRAAQRGFVPDRIVLQLGAAGGHLVGASPA